MPNYNNKKQARMFWKAQQKNTFTEIKKLAKGLSLYSSHSAVQKFIQILNQLFPTFSQSLLSNLYQESFKTSSEKWQKIYSFAVQILGPKSQFGKALADNKDVKIEIDNLNFSSQFENYMKQSQLQLSQKFKKQDFSAIKVPIFQCFFICLGLCIATLKDHQRKIEWENAFYQNEFYFYVTRNPILIIIKNWLTEIRSNPPLYNRLMFILQTIFLKDSMNHIKKKQKTHIKSAIMHAIYMISQWKVGIYHWQFLQCLVTQLQKKNNSSDILTLWVKLNLSILMNATPLEANVRKKLLNFNHQHPVFTMKYFESMQIFSQQSFRTIEFRSFQCFLFKTQSLIKKNFWSCTPSFMQAVYLIIMIAKSFDQNEEMHQNDEMFELIFFLKNVVKNASWNLKSNEAKLIVQKIQRQFNTSKPVTFLEDEEEQTQLNSLSNNQSRAILYKNERENIQSRQRKSLIIHHSQVNAWFKPLQSDQSALLFQASKFLAKRIDRLRGFEPIKDKKSDNMCPNTNLRFLASWKVLVLLFILFAVFLSYFTK